MHIHPLISDSATLANLCARMADAGRAVIRARQGATARNAELVRAAFAAATPGESHA
jgi:hypothetical protein